MRGNTAERKGFRIRRPAAFVVGLSMLVLSPAAHGQKAWLDLRPLSGVSASGVHTVFGWCGDVVGGTPCSSTADCVGDANGEQCYQTIELNSDDQEVYFEAWVSNWASFPNKTCWSPFFPQDTGNPCNDGNDCTGDEICGGSVVGYYVGLDCSGYDNGIAVLDVPSVFGSCGEASVPLPPDGFCADVDTNNPDWIHSNAVSTIGGCVAVSLCPQGEHALPWLPCGSVVSSGVGKDGTLNGEAYLVTYAVRVPAGGKGTWELFLEDDQDDPSNVQIRHDNFPADDYFVDFNIPLTITVATGRCCDVSGTGTYLGCVDFVTFQECAILSGDPSPWWHEGGSCWGVDEMGGDGIDDACSMCKDFSCNDADQCTQNICEDFGGGTQGCMFPDNVGLDRDVDCCNPATGGYTPIDDGDPSTVDTCDQATGQVTHVPVDVVPLWPENSLGITTCTLDSDCANEAYCVPDADGGFPGTCYVPKNRYLSVASNAGNIVPTARRLSVVTFNRSCGGAGKTSCTTDAQCAGNPEGSSCDDVRTGSQVIGWFGQPNADGYVGVAIEVDRHYTIWPDLTFPFECGVDELCPAESHCDTGLGASNTCRWDADDTEVPSTVVHLSGCHISPKRRDVRPGVDENPAANFYLIEAIIEGSNIADPSNYSTPLELRTVVVWGDMTGGKLGNVALPPEGSPGFLDVLQQVKRFKDRGEATTAWLDLDPQDPDRGVGFLDMLKAVGAFKGEPYPWDDPCICAGLAPCN